MKHFLFFLAITYKHLGTGETSCWSFERGKLPYSWLTQNSSCLAVLLGSFVRFLVLPNVFSWSKDVELAPVYSSALYYWNMQGLQAYVALKPVYWLFQMCIHIPSEMQAYELSADNNLESPSSLVRSSQCPCFPKRSWDFSSSDHFASVHFKLILP